MISENIITSLEKSMTMNSLESTLENFPIKAKKKHNKEKKHVVNKFFYIFIYLIFILFNYK